MDRDIRPGFFIGTCTGTFVVAQAHAIFKLEPREGRGESENIYNFGDMAQHTETVTHALALAYIRTIKRLLHGNPYNYSLASLLRVDPMARESEPRQGH